MVDTPPDASVDVGDEAQRRWFLSRGERGDAAGDLRAEDDGWRGWAQGCLVRPLVHGATYFAALHAALSGTSAGDRLWFTDWRGDSDERLLPEGPSIGELLVSLARRGVEVRGLLWRSHLEKLSSSISGLGGERLGREVNEAGGEVLLDQRVRPFGSHHQKLVVVRHRDRPERDVAFVGGIDLRHSRRDDADHGGDPQALDLGPRYGPRPPWHDAVLELRGPVVADVLAVFAERWDDPHPLDERTPLRMLLQRLARMPRHPSPLPEAFPPPQSRGPHAVQLLRTYPAKRPPFPFAPDGERGIARAYGKAFGLARSLVYLEDQYLWSTEVLGGLAEALRAKPGLRVIAVVPRFPDSDGRVSGPLNRLGQQRALRLLHAAAPGRVAVFDLENRAGTPIYVHAKVCVVDDVWMTVGSDNVNRRSWTNDSELTSAVVDTTRDTREPLRLPGALDDARVLPRDLRLQLWAEHLGLTEDDERLLHPDTAWRLWNESASALDAWHERGLRGPRPAGHARHHRTEPVSAAQERWASPLYDLAVDPDGRPRRLRGTTSF